MADFDFANVKSPSGPYGYTAVDMVLDQAGSELRIGADFDQFQVTGREMVVLFNSTGSPINFLPVSVADSKGRTASSTQTTQAVAAGDTVMAGPFEQEGWANASGKMRMQASAVGLRACVVRLPAVA